MDSKQLRTTKDAGTDLKGNDLGGKILKMRAKRLKMIKISIFPKGKGGNRPPLPVPMSYVMIGALNSKTTMFGNGCWSELWTALVREGWFWVNPYSMKDKEGKEMKFEAP